MDVQTHCDQLHPRPECPDEEQRIAHDGAMRDDETTRTKGSCPYYSGDSAANSLENPDHERPTPNVGGPAEEGSKENVLLVTASNNTGWCPRANDGDKQTALETNGSDNTDTSTHNTDSTGSDQHAVSQTDNTEGKRNIEDETANAENKVSHEVNDNTYHNCIDRETRPSNGEVGLMGDKHHTSMAADCNQREHCASMNQRDPGIEQPKHSTENDQTDSEASALHCSDNCDIARDEKHRESRPNNNTEGECGLDLTNSGEKATQFADNMTRENSGSFHGRNVEETDLVQVHTTEKTSTVVAEQMGRNSKCQENQDVTDLTENDSATTNQHLTEGTESMDSQYRDSDPAKRRRDNTLSAGNDCEVAAQAQTQGPQSAHSSGENPGSLSQVPETACSKDHQCLKDTMALAQHSSKNHQCLTDTMALQQHSSSNNQPTASSTSLEESPSEEHQHVTDTTLKRHSPSENQRPGVGSVSSEDTSANGRRCSQETTAKSEEEQSDIVDGGSPRPEHQQCGGMQGEGEAERRDSWSKRAEEYYDCSDSTEDEGEDAVDPRVAENLEIMNQSCADVNRLENELDEARNKYRLTFTASSQRMEELGSKIKKSIQRARQFFELTEKAKEAQNEAVRAARQFQTASGHYRAAKEMITLAEQSFYDKEAHTTHNLSSALQETLNHATERVMESEREKTRSEAEHNKRAAIYAQLETQLQLQEKKYKRSIAKARPYFETKAELELKLQQLKQNVWDLQQAISTRKTRYAEALRNLETVSTEIHESRRRRQKMLLQYPREPGVGAESDSLCSSISDANIERNVFSSTASYEDDMEEDEDDLSDDSSEVSSHGSRGHSRQNSRDRPLVTKTSSLRRADRRHKRSVSSGSAPDSVFSSPPGSLPQSPASLSSPDPPSNGFSVVPVFAGRNGGSVSEGAMSAADVTSGPVSSSSASSSNATTTSCASRVSASGSVSSNTSSASASASGAASSPAATASGLPPRLMDIAQGDCSDDEAKAKVSTEPSRTEGIDGNTRGPAPKGTGSSVQIQERMDGDGSAGEDSALQREGGGNSTVKIDNNNSCSGPSLHSLPSNKQSMQVTGSTNTTSRQSTEREKASASSKTGTGSSGQTSTANAVFSPSADQAHHGPKQFFTKAKQFLKKATSAPHAHTRLDNRASTEKDVNANPHRSNPFHIGAGPSPVRPYLGPGLPQTGIAPSQNGTPPNQNTGLPVPGKKSGVEVKKQPLRRTDGGRSRPLQGIFVLNPSDLASSSPSSSSFPY